ncbi:ABC transporter ATP-binding protein [Sphingosinicella sp.]|uniref:ABC transporter ATP-binding protein n=1 Tax=Sphingosinicella sp. TaxID=1917971 RepID=UPI004038173A
MLSASGLSLPHRLFDASLEIGGGELVCLVGPNGGGKTSLLHALAGIGGAPGTMSLDGKDPRREGPARRPRLMTFLPAAREAAWPLLARDLIALGGGDGALPELELDLLLDRRIDSLSTGERGRVLLARALAPQPKLLLLDEPTANLDPLWRIRVMELIHAEVTGTQRAALVAIHDLDAAERYADRILVMNAGRIVAEELGDAQLTDVFGIARGPEGWTPAVNPSADRRSSP